MTREIKFRAWDKEHKKMVNDVYNHSFYKSLNDCLKNSNVMQYTGLKDKNGKEIYEGDILGIGGKSHSVIVPLSNNDFPTGGFTEKYFTPQYPEPNTLRFKEVIGNKFENPELLEQEEGNE